MSKVNEIAFAPIFDMDILRSVNLVSCVRVYDWGSLNGMAYNTDFALAGYLVFIGLSAAGTGVDLELQDRF